METQTPPQPEAKKKRASRARRNADRAESWRNSQQLEAEGNVDGAELSQISLSREDIDLFRSQYEAEYPDGTSEDLDAFVGKYFGSEDLSGARAYAREKLSLGGDEYEASFDDADNQAESEPVAPDVSTPERTPGTPDRFRWDLVENDSYQVETPVAVYRTDGSLDGIETGWRVRKVIVTGAGEAMVEIEQPPAEGAIDQNTLLKTVPEAELHDMQQKFAETVAHTVESSFGAEDLTKLRELYETRRALHARLGVTNPGSQALEDIGSRVTRLVKSADKNNDFDEETYETVTSDLNYYLLRVGAEEGSPEPSAEAGSVEDPAADSEADEADTPQRRRNMAQRISDRFNQLALAAYAVYPNAKKEGSVEGMTDTERKRSGKNRILVAGVVAVAAVGVMYARTKGFDFDVPGQEIAEAVPVDAVAEVPVETVEHSAEALEIDNGEGWYQTFKEMGIPKEEWSSLLDRVGEKLPDDVAYFDKDAGEWRMNMTDDGKMPKEVLDMIHSEWQGEGAFESSQLEGATTETSLAEETIAAEDSQAAETSAETGQAGHQVDDHTGGPVNSGPAVDNAQVNDAVGQAVELQNTAETTAMADKVLDVANSEYIRVDGGSITIDRAMDTAALARELHISQDKATYLLQSLSMNTELSSAVAENSAGQLEIKPVKITNSNAILAIQTAAGQLRS